MDFFEWFLTGKRTPPASIIGGERHPLLLLFWVVAELMWDEKVRWNGNTTIFESIDFCLVWGPINKTQWGAIYRRVVATAAYITEIEKKWYTYHYTTFGRVSPQRPELLIFHFGTSWCHHPMSPSSLKLLVVASEFPTLTFWWFKSNLVVIAHLVLNINGRLSFRHLSTKVGNTGFWYHVMILPFWETATLCNPKFCRIFGRQLWKRFKGRLLPKYVQKC